MKKNTSDSTTGNSTQIGRLRVGIFRGTTGFLQKSILELCKLLGLPVYMLCRAPSSSSGSQLGVPKSREGVAPSHSCAEAGFLTRTEFSIST